MYNMSIHAISYYRSRIVSLWEHIFLRICNSYMYTCVGCLYMSQCKLFCLFCLHSDVVTFYNTRSTIHNNRQVFSYCQDLNVSPVSKTGGIIFCIQKWMFQVRNMTVFFINIVCVSFWFFPFSYGLSVWNLPWSSTFFLILLFNNNW